MQPLISVIVPVYNVEKYLPLCIESLISQMYENIEIFLVNDGSSDGSLDICKAYEKKDQRISVVNKENGGVASARNMALKLAKGEFVGFIDSDDWIEADMYSRLYDNIVKYDADISQCDVVIENEDQVSVLRAGTNISVYENNGATRYLLCGSGDACYTCNKLYRRELIADIFFDEEKRVGEDFLYNYVVNKKNPKLVCDNAQLYHYIRHEGSLTSHTSIQKFLDTMDMLDELYLHETDISLSESWKYQNVVSARNIINCLIIQDSTEHPYYKKAKKKWLKQSMTVLFKKGTPFNLKFKCYTVLLALTPFVYKLIIRKRIR